MLATFLLASDCATQAMYFGRYVEVGVESPPIWRVASSCIDDDLPKALHAIHGDQLIPIGEPGDRGLRSFGSGMQIAFPRRIRRHAWVSSWRLPSNPRVNLFGLIPSRKLSPQRSSRLRPRWRLEGGLKPGGPSKMFGSSVHECAGAPPEDEPVRLRILAAGFDRFYMEIFERPNEVHSGWEVPD